MNGKHLRPFQIFSISGFHNNNDDDDDDDDDDGEDDDDNKSYITLS